MKKKTGIFLIIGIVLALMLTGCGKQSVETETAHTTEEDKLQIGLSFDSFVIERWLRDRDMFVSTAQSLGAEVNVQVAGGEVEEQISQIEYFIQKKMDVIIIIPIDGDALYDVVKEAKSKGICVICYDRIIPNVNADLYITIDNEMVGTLMGEALKRACPDGGNIFAIYGSPTDKNVEEVEKGFKDALVDSKLNIVYSGYCDNWLAEIAETHVNKGLEVTDEPLARRTRSGRKLPPDAARGNRGVLRRGRNRAGPLLESRLPGRAGRSLPPPDRPFAAIRTADRRAYARRLARNRRHHARIPRPGRPGRFPRLFRRNRNLSQTEGVRRFRFRNRRRSDL